MAPGGQWDSKRLEQRGDQLIEDGRPRPGDIHERTLELVREGWEIVALSPTGRRLRRLAIQTSQEPARPYPPMEDPPNAGSSNP